MVEKTLTCDTRFLTYDNFIVMVYRQILRNKFVLEDQSEFIWDLRPRDGNLIRYVILIPRILADVQ